MDIKDLVSQKIKIDGVEKQTIYDMLSIPPKAEMGDFALPCFSVAKILHRSPNDIAKNLADELVKDSFIQKAEVLNGYLNIYVNKQVVTKEIVEELTNKTNLSANNSGNNKKVCIDFSSVNIAKEPHIGHFATTVIGASIARLYENSGYNVVRMNYLGDYGSQFAKLLYAYNVWSSQQEIQKGGVSALQKLYIKANEECDKNPEFLNNCRLTFKKFEQKDPQLVKDYEWFKKISIDESQKILFTPLNIKFDDWRGESYYSQFTEDVVKELEQKGLAHLSQGAMIVDLQDYNLGVAVVRQSNGTSIYCSRDISAVLHRHNEYNFDKCIYITGQEQEFYFKQLFKIVELMGYGWSKDLMHIINGRLSTPQGKLSSRLGSVALAKDIMADAVEKAADVIALRTGKPADPALAKQIGLGALIFSVLKSDISKDHVFVVEDALNFDGETAPYIMYTHARCCSILDKAKLVGECDYTDVINNGWELIKLLNNYNATVLVAQQKNDPSIIAKYAINLATIFNKFYHDTRIITDNQNKVNAGLKVVELTKRTIAESLALLGISAPQKM